MYAQLISRKRVSTCGDFLKKIAVGVDKVEGVTIYVV